MSSLINKCILLATIVALFATSSAADYRGNLESWADAKAKQYGISHTLLKSICHVESNWKVDAIGSAGEIGLCQLKIGTVRQICKKCYVSDDEIIATLANPWKNIELAAIYLRFLKAVVGDDETLLMASYNGGPGVGLYVLKVRKTMEVYGG